VTATSNTVTMMMTVVILLQPGFPLMGIPASLMPKNHAGTPNFGMSGVQWTLKNEPEL